MIGAVVALESEAEALLSQMEIEDIRTIYGKTVHLGRAFGKECLLVVCGVGKVNAAAGACAAISFGADVVLNFGVAGGLHERTEVAEVYLVEKAVQYDFDITQLEGCEIGTLDGETENFLPLYTPKGIDFPRRKLATGDRFNDSPADHALLLRLGADLRDMEGGAIVEVCKYAGVPCVSFKSVSDVYGSGSTTAQYEKNLALARLSLKAALIEVFAALD